MKGQGMRRAGLRPGPSSHRPAPPVAVPGGRLGRIVAALCCLPFLGAAVRAEQFGFQLRPSSTAIIGTPVDLVGSVSFPSRYSLPSQPVEKDTGPFTISGIEVSPPKEENGIKRHSVRLTVVAWDVGVLTFPPLTWTLAAAGSSETLRSPPVRLEVRAPEGGPGKEDGIRDIKPPLAPHVWPAVLLLVLLGALAAYGFSEYRRRHGPVPIASPEPADTRPADVIALEALARLNFREMTPKEYYDRLSDIVRLYLERRFGIPAMTLTTTDLVRQMRQAEIERAVVAEAKALFDLCDLVKFAKLEPGEADAERDRETAAALVRVTAPPPPAEATPQQTGGRTLQS